MKKGIQKVLVMLLALSMIFSTMAMPAFADDGAADTGKIPYTGETVSFIKADGSGFGMFTAQDGTTCEVQGDNVVIHYVPKNTTTYGGFNWGSIDDAMYKDQENRPDPAVKPNEDGSYDITLSKDYCGSAWPVAVVKNTWKSGSWTSGDQYYLAIPPELMEITNNTGMFKVVKAYLTTEGEQEYLVVTLSKDSYHELCKGTYEQAVAGGDGTVENGNGSWIHGAVNEEGKWEFKVPVGADEAYIPIVSVSNTYYPKYLKGEVPLARSFYPRQFVIDRDAMTLTVDDYDDMRDMECTNNVSMFKVSKAQIHVVGGPNSNTYVTDLILTMGSASYDKMFVGTIEEAEQADAIALAEGNIFTFSVKDLLGKTFVASFHSESKDTWYERLVTINEDGTAITFDKKADYSADTEALSHVPGDLSIYTDATTKAVRDAVDAVDYTKKETEQADVDAMAEAINNAVAGLKIDIAKAKVTGLKDQTFSGKAFTQTPVVTVNGKQLVPKKDYEVSYKNNTNAGKATVTITGKGDYAGKATATFTIAKAAQSVTGPKATISKTYGAKAFNLGAKTNGGGKITYTTSNAKVAVVSSAGKVTIKGAGTAKITIKAAETTNYKAATKTVTVKVAKAANKMTASGKTAKVSYSKLKKGKQTVTKTKASAVKNGNGKVTFTKSKGNAKITVSKAGKITVKKGLKKGTYKVKVQVKAAGNSNYKAKTKTVTVTIKVK